MRSRKDAQRLLRRSRAATAAPLCPPPEIVRGDLPLRGVDFQLESEIFRVTPEIFRLTSLRQGYGGPPKYLRRRKAEAT